MDTRYIYAGTRAKTMENDLLTKTQLEVLLSAKSVEEAYKALQDTFLAPYLSKNEKSDLENAVGRSLLEAKKVLESIAPEPELLEIIWLKYDFYNLKTIVKGKIAGFPAEEIKNNCSVVGKYDPSDIIKSYEENKLSILDKNLGQAAKETSDFREVSDIDIIISKKYFETIKEISEKTKNIFVKEYVSLSIDLFNIISKLRLASLRSEGNNVKDIFIEGGKIMEKDLRGEKDILEKIKKVGNEKRWVEALDHYKKTNNYTLLEKEVEDLKIDFLKEKSQEIFSIAPLFSYFIAKINDTSIIKAIISGKHLGISERDIRFSLRKIYV